MATEYRVRIDAFEGPVDLLLHLIRRAEVDVTDIPIALVADQYMTYLEEIDRIDIERAGEFLVMAATLMEIKSRMLVPVEKVERDTGANDEDDDPRADLVRQLLEYRKFRDLADALEERREDWERRFPAARADVGAPDDAHDDVEIEDLEIVDLIRAFNDICESVNFDRLGAHEVTFDDTPQELHAADLVDQLQRASSPVRLRAMFEGRTRPEMIGLFLAMLEMVKQRRLRVLQQDADIVVELEDEPDPDAMPTPEAKLPEESSPEATSEEAVSSDDDASSVDAAATSADERVGGSMERG